METASLSQCACRRDLGVELTWAERATGGARSAARALLAVVRSTWHAASTASLVAGAISATLCACSSETNHPPLAKLPPSEETQTEVDRCATPNTGCACDAIGTTVPCGKVTLQSGSYVLCTIGNRECLVDGTWGDCVGDRVTTKSTTHLATPGGPAARTHMQAVVSSTVCQTNVCDPYCNYVENDGQNLTNLPSGLCTGPTGGVIACDPSCQYAGPRAKSGYSTLSASWQKLPTSCTADADGCGYDSDCVAGACAAWTPPCYDPNPPGCAIAKRIDLELGPPCAGAGSAYHFQICNRGADRADSGTVKIGVYSSSAKLSTVVAAGATPGAPDQGSVTFTLAATPGNYIDPGKCLDINPGNSTATPSPLVGLTATRAIAVNYDASLPECNYANNWNVYDSTIACTGCTGLTCNQTCAATTLTGRIYDPAGVNPVPGVIVYVPNSTVGALTDGVHCDTCANLYTGTPIASTMTAADGTFTLSNVPSGVSFPLVIQIGRWRRQVTVTAITACGTAALPTGENSRLPSKKSEGDIPLMALSMSAGDHLECLLRKIGIEDSEFTNSAGAGRVHLYAYNGLTFPGTTCVPPTGGRCATDLWSSPSQLDKYNAIIAPCDKNPYGGSPSGTNQYVGTSTAPIGYGAGPYPNAYGFTSFARAQAATNFLNTDRPAFLTAPDSAVPTLTGTPSSTQAANMKAYLDKGGRLFSTHWMAYFFTYNTYPAAVNYVFGTYVDYDRQGSGATGTNFPYTIDISSSTGQTLAAWLGTSTVTFTNWRHLAESVNPPTLRLAYGDSTKPPVNHPSCTVGAGPTYAVSPAACATNGQGWGGPMVSAYQFDAPWNVPVTNQCGRVVVAQSHVSKLSGPTATTNQQTAFPGTCDSSAMTGEEKAFEFLLFSTTQCVGLVAPPPPIPPLQPTTFTYDYEGICPAGTNVEWEFFSWKATVPSGTSIVFKAQTADTQAGLAAAPQVGVGTASADATVWTSDPNTVNWHIQTDLPTLARSSPWLRISATLNPAGTTSPTLNQWQQLYDCVPAQ